MAWHGEARQAGLWRGLARCGPAGLGVVGHGWARQARRGMSDVARLIGPAAWSGMASFGLVRRGEVRRGQVGHGLVWCGGVRLGTVRFGGLRYGMARCDVVRQGLVR